ncbi:MAG: efflux RND transporter permease subunit [Planctomyces sp.]
MKSLRDSYELPGRKAAIWLPGIAAFLLPLIMYSLSNLKLQNDVGNWLPDSDEQSAVLNWYQNLFPDDDRILASWDGCSLTDPRMAEFARRLEGRRSGEIREGGSPFIAEVTEPADLLRRMRSRDIPLTEALERTGGLLTGRGPLRVELAEFARLHSRSVGERAVRLGAEKFGIAVRIVSHDLPAPSQAQFAPDDAQAQELFQDLTDWLSAQKPADLQLQWSDMHVNEKQTADFIAALSTLTVPGLKAEPAVKAAWFVPGAVAAVSISLSEAGSAEHSNAIQAIRDAAAASGIAADELHLGGRTVAAVALNHGVRQAAWNADAPLWMLWLRSPLLLAAIVGFGCSLATLRSLRLALMVQGVSMFTAAAATALIVPFGGSMNMVLVVMPTLLLVVTVSGSFHLCNYWRQLGHREPAEAVAEAVARAWTPCVLAAITTAIGLASLMISSLMPVRQFGLYASLGCLISLGAVLYLLPAMMLYLRMPAAEMPAEELPQSGLNRLWLRCGHMLCRWSGFNLGLSFAVTALAVTGLTWFRTETKAIRYFPEDSRVVSDYRFLEDNLAGIIPVDAIVRFSRTHQKLLSFQQRTAAVMRLQQKLTSHPEISGSLSLASFMPAGEDVKASGRAARLRDNLTEDKLYEVLRDQNGPRQSVHSLMALSQSTVELPGSRRILQKNGDEIWRVTCQASILSDADYRQLTDDLTRLAGSELQDLPGGRPACIVTGLVPIFLRTQDALLESLISSFLAAFVLITAVMVVLLRDAVAAVISMIPNVAPATIVFGILGWMGVRVDVGTMVTASVALGLAVDGTLHFLHVFRQELKPDVTREEAVARATAQCAPAIWQTSCAVGIGVLTLFPAELLLISRFGWVLAALVLAAMWGDLILLPSLLNGMLGDILVEQKRAADAAALAVVAARSASPQGATPVVMDVDVKPFVAIDSHPPAIVAVRPPHFQVRYSPNASARE